MPKFDGIITDISIVPVALSGCPFPFRPKATVIAGYVAKTSSSSNIFIRKNGEWVEGKA